MSENATERTTAFVATVEWDEDTQHDDVKSVCNALESAGYDTRMETNNSALLVMRDRSVDTGEGR